MRFSNPSAEALVRQDLINTIVQTMDKDFVDPTKAASAGVSPASITNGVTPVVASGTDADALKADFKKLVAYSSISHMGYVILGIAVWTTLDRSNFWSWA